MEKNGEPRKKKKKKKRSEQGGNRHQTQPTYDTEPESEPVRISSQSHQSHHSPITDPQSNFILQDNLVTLHVMLTSPHVADLKPLVETWITNLQEVENITDIWADCQKKVLAKRSVVHSGGW